MWHGVCLYGTTCKKSGSSKAVTLFSTSQVTGYCYAAERIPTPYQEMIEGVLLLATGLELQRRIYFCVLLHAS